MTDQIQKSISLLRTKFMGIHQNLSMAKKEIDAIDHCINTYYVLLTAVSNGIKNLIKTYDTPDINITLCKYIENINNIIYSINKSSSNFII